VPKIPPGVGQPRRRPGVSMELLGLFDAAKRALRRKPRVLRRQAAPLEVILEQSQMGRDLPREIRFRLRWSSLRFPRAYRPRARGAEVREDHAADPRRARACARGVAATSIPVRAPGDFVACVWLGHHSCAHAVNARVRALECVRCKSACWQVCFW
jgi:hypothetical protein